MNDSKLYLITYGYGSVARLIVGKSWKLVKIMFTTCGHWCGWTRMCWPNSQSKQSDQQLSLSVCVCTAPALCDVCATLTLGAVFKCQINICPYYHMSHISKHLIFNEIRSRSNYYTLHMIQAKSVNLKHFPGLLISCQID